MTVKNAPRLVPDAVGDNEDLVRKALEAADEPVVEMETVALGVPTLDRVVVQEVEADEMVGSLYLPPSARAGNNPRGPAKRGTVKVLGQGMILESGEILDVFTLFGIEIGSIVTWREYGGTLINERHGLHVVSTQDIVYVEQPDG